MNDSESSVKFLKELRAFLAFLQNLWGLLAGISVFFPLSNLLLKVIPMGAYGNEGGVYNLLAPALITGMATLTALFVLLALFINRSQFRKTVDRHSALRSAWVSFVVAILFLIGYLVLYRVYAEYAWAKWGWGSDDPRKLIAEVPLMVSYVAFFSLLTRAFVLLGMIEYFRPRKEK